MTQSILYEIIETGNKPQAQKRKLDFSGTFEEAKIRAQEEAKKNIGVRYAVFREGAFVAEFQAYYRTTVKCPKCGEIIPIE
jgi:formamidopyrimidine-DNA glycosylase